MVILKEEMGDVGLHSIENGSGRIVHQCSNKYGHIISKR